MKVLTKIFAAIMVVAVCSACLCSCNDDDEDENAVKFRYDLFDEPCTQWGALEKKVKSFYESYYSLNTYPELSYYGKKREHLHICAFEEGMLVKTSVIVKAREVRIAEVEGFLDERYYHLGDTAEGESFYLTRDWKTLVKCAIKSSSSIGLYYLFEYTKADSKMIEQWKDEADKL